MNKLLVLMSCLCLCRLACGNILSSGTLSVGEFYTAPAPSTNINADVVVYGASAGGVMAAIQLERLGNAVVLIAENEVVGGMTVQGLSAADVGIGTNYLRGLAREFYVRVAGYYTGVPPAYFNAEPHVYQQVIWDMINDSATNGGTLVICSNQPLVSVDTNLGTIITLTTTSTNYAASFFIDCSYAGDLMAMAGCSFLIGREGTNVWNETNAGVQSASAVANVSPFINYSNGEVLNLIDTNAPGQAGDGDGSVQAYCYRLCLTKIVSNMVPFFAPANYVASNYALVSRCVTNVSEGSLGSICQLQSLANSKYDCNGAVAAPVTIDYVGQSRRYVTNSRSGRLAWSSELKDYVQGLLYFLGNDTSLQAGLRNDVSTYGYCKDEFQSSSNFPVQVYIREGRRMVSDYTMTHSNTSAQVTAPHSICLAAYPEDSHQCNRYFTATPTVVNEGNIVNYYSPALGGWPVEYMSIIPKTNECVNLLVPVAVSASHLAFGSYRMEPVFMNASQSAAVAAHICIQSNWTVQGLIGNYLTLSNALILVGQKLK